MELKTGKDEGENGRTAKTYKHIRTTNVFEGSEASGEGQVGPKMAPRWAQVGLRWAREATKGPKMAPRWLEGDILFKALAPDGPKTAHRGPKEAPRRPRWAQDGPKRAQDSARMAQDGAKMVSWSSRRGKMKAKTAEQQKHTNT